MIWSRSRQGSAAGVPRERQRAGLAPRRHLYLIRGQNSSIRFRWLIRSLLSLSLLFGVLALLFVGAGPAGATFPTSLPNGECNTHYIVGNGGAYLNVGYDGIGEMMSCNLALANGVTPSRVTSMAAEQWNPGSDYDYPQEPSCPVPSSPCSGWLWCGLDGSTPTLDCTVGTFSGLEACLEYGEVDCVPPSIYDDATNETYDGIDIGSIGYITMTVNMQEGTPGTTYTAWSTETLFVSIPWGHWGGSSFVVTPGSDQSSVDPPESVLEGNCTGSVLNISSPQSAWALVWPSNTQAYDDETYCTVDTFSWPAYPTDYYGTVAPPAQSSEPCGLLYIQSGITADTQVVSGTNYPVTFNYEGPVSDIVVDPGDNSSLTLDGKTFASDADVDADPSSSGVDTVSVTPPGGSAGYAGDTAWCYGDGEWYDWGSIVNGRTITGAAPGSTNTTSCVATDGMSLTDPVSWVTGAWNLGVCELGVLFEPSSAAVASVQQVFGLSDTTGECTGAVGATQWVGCIGKGVLGTPVNDVTAFQSAVDSTGTSCSNSQVGSNSGVFAVDNPLTGRAVDSISFCTVLDDSVTGGSASTSNTVALFTFLHGLLVAAFWLAMVFVLIRYLAGVFSSGSYPSSGGDDSGGGE